MKPGEEDSPGLHELARQYARGGEIDVQSPAGILLRKAATLRSALHLGFTLTLADVTFEQFRAIEILDREIQRAKAAGPEPPKQWAGVD